MYRRSTDYQDIKDYQDLYYKETNPDKDNEKKDFYLSLTIVCIALIAMLCALVFIPESGDVQDSNKVQDIGVSQTPEAENN